MQRRIDLMNNSYTVTVTCTAGNQKIQVDDQNPAPVALIKLNGCAHQIEVNGQKEDIQIVVKGETAYIKAFGRTFTLEVVDPVEQASQESGGSDNAKAPMPGMVVDIHVAQGDKVNNGQDLITIESMKILTVITAPRDGEVSGINFEPGSTFDKNDVLVTLKEKEDA